ncbi:MAG: hypothetical protein ACRC0L_13155, partial [Angustibacter sp.]
NSSAPSPTVLLYDDGSSGPAEVAPTLDLASRVTAQAMAVRVLRMFARRDLPADRWFKNLAPYLTPQAADAYQYSDPTGAPSTEVLDTGRFLPDSTAALAKVSVHTRAGVYLVLLTRNSEQRSWRVDRLVPPENVGD